MSSLVGACAECCECAAPIVRFIPDVSVSCSSNTATPELVGWSAYTNQNDGPVYKWKSRTLSGSFDERLLVGSPSTECDREGVAVFSGVVARDEAGLTSYANLHYTDYQEFGPLPCVISSENDYPVTDMVSNEAGVWTFVLPGTCSGVNEIRYSVTQTVRTVTRCAGGPDTGSGTETLGDPDTVASAILRAAPVAGVACCAATGAIEMTAAEDTTPLAVDESTSVTLTITVTGTPNTEYPLQLIYTNSCDGVPSENTTDPDFTGVTTDETGVAVVEVVIPDPAPNCTRCFYSVVPDFGVFYYTFAFKIPKVGFGRCYSLTWTERFIPDDPGDPIDVEKNWQWAPGDIPADYNPDDPSTYPITHDGEVPYFTPTDHGITGTIQIINVNAVCRSCSETSNITPLL